MILTLLVRDVTMVINTHDFDITSERRNHGNQGNMI